MDAKQYMDLIPSNKYFEALKVKMQNLVYIESYLLENKSQLDYHGSDAFMNSAEMIYRYINEYNDAPTDVLVNACEKAVKYDEMMASYTPKKTKLHKWKVDESGEIDSFGYSDEYHNGPMCEICGYNFCHHCYPDGYNNENCDEHYICECGQHLNGSENFCSKCGKRLSFE